MLLAILFTFLIIVMTKAPAAAATEEKQHINAVIREKCDFTLKPPWEIR